MSELPPPSNFEYLDCDMTCNEQVDSESTNHCSQTGHLWEPQPLVAWCFDSYNARYECCGKTFRSSSSWKKHTEVCRRTCDVCRITFPNVKIYEEHWADTHGNNKKRQRRAKDRKSTKAAASVVMESNEAFRRDPSSQKHVDLKLPFGCFDCPLRCASIRRLVNHCREMEHRRFWPCVACMVAFPHKEELSRHRIELDVPAHRHCLIAPCNTLFATIELYQAHYRENHEFLPPLVSPEAQRLRKEVAKEQLEESLMGKERVLWEEEMKRKKREKAERKKQEAERKERERQALRREMESMGPVQCHLCPKTFKTPAAYSQHLESNSKKHRQVGRHHVTQAVQMLDVIPSITLQPSVEYQPSIRAESTASSSSISPFTSVPSSPRTDMEGSWILLGDEDSTTGPVVLAPSASMATVSRTPDSPPPSATLSPLDGPKIYTANDFMSLGIPYACPLCFKTFRTVVQLTGHMNSPVHDPDAFKCPKPECGRQFALVSGLIQHLESGTCKLASAGEIFERFALLTARFSKYLAA